MRKRTRNIMIAAVAACTAVVLACAAFFALVPSVSSRYIDEDHYAGEVMTDATESGNHGGHTEWTQITQDSFGSSGTYTISSAGNYYLAGDVQGRIAVTVSGTNDENRAVVNLCLAGHVLDGNGAGTALLIGDPAVYVTQSGSSTEYGHNSTYVTVNLLDCGGSKKDGNYDNVHYYKRGTAHTLSDGTAVYEGYDFSSASEKDCDGYVRGGLITGGTASGNYYGGGVTVGYDTELNMYGGTVAGNDVSGGVAVDTSDDADSNRTYDGTYTGGGVAVRNASFNLYGGTIEGNFNPKTDRTSAGGVLLCPDLYLPSTTYDPSSESEGRACFNMYGGEIRDNYTEGGGGGVNAFGFTSSGDRAHVTYFYMCGGVIEGNYAAAVGSDSGGGGVSVYGSAHAEQETYFDMCGGATIRDNVCSGPGAGVFASCVCQCSIAGRITGNRSFGNSVGAAGFCGLNINYTNTVDSSRNIPADTGLSVITVEGSAYIYGNYSNGKKSNFGELINRDVIIDYAYITLGELKEGARIGVTLFLDTVAASRTSPNLALYNPLRITVADDSGNASSCLKYFYSDDSAYNVGVGSDDNNSTTYIKFVAKGQ